MTCSRALLAAPLKAGGAFYVCSAGGPNETLFRLALRDAGMPLKQSLVWVKHHFVLGRQDFQWKHETLLYGWKPGATHYFCRRKDADDRVGDRAAHAEPPASHHEAACPCAESH